MIGIIGLSHKSAPLEVRERYAFNQQNIDTLSNCILSGGQVEEVVILSTCNRTEIYFMTQSNCIKGAVKQIDQCLHEFSEYDSTSKEYFYHLFDARAVTHLFRLISGLESMIVGEYQIVAQIKDAFQYAQKQSTTRKILNRLFTKALEVGKQVRTYTGISRGAFSVSYAAVEKCREHFSHIEKRKILLIGAGETGELVLKNFHKRGSHKITIANRTLEKAQELAVRYNAETVPLENLRSAIRGAEIVISSITGEHLINKDLLGAAPFDHKVMMVDLGVPRNIHPDVAGISHVKLLNIDDLQQVVTQNEEKKKSYFDVAERIIAEKGKEFDEWLMTQKLSPAIQLIASSLRQLHNDGLAAFKSSASEEEIEIMNSYGQHLSEKMIKTLIKNLKSTTENGRKEDVVEVVNKLFQ